MIVRNEETNAEETMRPGLGKASVRCGRFLPAQYVATCGDIPMALDRVFIARSNDRRVIAEDSGFVHFQRL